MVHVYYHILHVYIETTARLWAKVCKKKKKGWGWVWVGVGVCGWVGVRMGVSVGGREGGDRPKKTKNG